MDPTFPQRARAPDSCAAVMQRSARTAQMNADSLLALATVTFRTREPSQPRSR